MGLIRAVERFDDRRGVAFSTYASYWIRQAMQRGAVLARERAGVGEEAESAERAVRRAIDEITAVTGRSPSRSEVAEATGYSDARVAFLLALPRVEYLDASPTDCSAEDESRELDDMIRRQDVRRAVDDLGDPERTLVRLRYGLGCPVTTTSEAATRCGISVNQAEVLLKRARARLADSLNEHRAQA